MGGQSRGVLAHRRPIVCCALGLSALFVMLLRFPCLRGSGRCQVPGGAAAGAGRASGASVAYTAALASAALPPTAAMLDKPADGSAAASAASAAAAPPAFPASAPKAQRADSGDSGAALVKVSVILMNWKRPKNVIT